jgi:cytochrome c-type biogenesis protein CcmH/NrfG
MDDLSSGEYPSETRQLSSEEQRQATGAGPSWLVVVAVVLVMAAAVSYVLVQ